MFLIMHYTLVCMHVVCLLCVCVLPELPGQGFLPAVCPGTAAGPGWRESAPVCRSSGVRAHQRAPAVGTEMKTDLFIYMKRNIQSLYHSTGFISNSE